MWGALTLLLISLKKVVRNVARFASQPQHLFSSIAQVEVR